MTTPTKERIGTFDFRVAASEKKPDADRRVAVLANWLLSDWHREQEKPRDKTAGRG